MQKSNFHWGDFEIFSIKSVNSAILPGLAGVVGDHFRPSGGILPHNRRPLKSVLAGFLARVWRSLCTYTPKNSGGLYGRFIAFYGVIYSGGLALENRRNVSRNRKNL